MSAKIGAEIIDNVEVLDAAEVEMSDLVIKLTKPYTFEGKEYSEIDLMGLHDLKGVDMIAINKAMERTGGFQVIPEMTTQYALLAASKVTGYPIEFFEGLNAKTVLKIKNRVTGFFYGED